MNNVPNIKKRSEMNKIVKFAQKAGLLTLPSSYRWNKVSEIDNNQERIYSFMEKLGYSQGTLDLTGMYEFPTYKSIVHRFKSLAKEKGYKGRINYKKMGKLFPNVVQVRILYNKKIGDNWIPQPAKVGILDKKHPDDVDKLVKRFLDGFHQGVEYIEIVDVQESPSAEINAKQWQDVKLKLASAPNIFWQDNKGECMFDQNSSEKGTCVVDFLEKMSNTKSSGKYRARKTIGSREDIIDDLTPMFGDSNPETDGVSAQELYDYCVNKDISCYLIDSDQKLRFNYQRKKDSKIPAIIAMCQEGHLYPIISKITRKSIVESAKGNGGKFMLSNKKESGIEHQVHIISETDTPPNNFPIHNTNYRHTYICSCPEQLLTFYLNYRENTNQIYKYTSSSKGMTSFTYRPDIKFILNPLYEIASKFIDNPKPRDNLHTILNPILEELKLNNINTKSVFQSEEVWLNINNNIVKSAYNYIHPDGTTSSDITIDKNKAYSCVLKNIDTILICNPTDIPCKYSGEEIISTALYWVDNIPATTISNILISKRGWYIASIVSEALKDNHITRSDITHIINCSSSIENPYRPFVDALYKKYGNEAKILANSFVGMFGKIYSDKGKLYITKKLEHIVKYDEEQFYQEKKFKTFKTGDEKTYYITLVQDKTLRYETSVIFNAQIVQTNRLNMYNMAKRVGGTLKAVKTDSITVSTPSWQPLHQPNNMDAWKIENTKIVKPKEKLVSETKKIIIPKQIAPLLTKSKVFKNEWDIEACIREINSLTGNIIIDGGAGTGKTFLANKLAHVFSLETEIITPTHCAKSKYSGAQTIHSFLGIDIFGKKIARISYKHIKRVIVDECSMIGVELFSQLVLLSQNNPHIQFILVGDFKQLQPVNDSSSIEMWKYFLSHHYELKVCKRAEDIETFNINEQLREHRQIPSDTFQITKDITKNMINLCKTNAERRYINNECIKKYQPAAEIYKIRDEFEYSEESDEDKIRKKELHTIYKGMPIMLLKTIKNCPAYDCDGQQGFDSIFNGYKFEIIDYKPKQQIIVKKLDCNNSFRYIIGWDRLKDFVPCYAMTVHKAQGQTITKPYTIHNYNQMCPTMKYVAVSRCKNYNQIFIS